MSKIGKKPINILEGVSLKQISENEFEIKGPKGSLIFTLPPEFRLEIDQKVLMVVPSKDLNRKTKALWGTMRAILQNKITGVFQGFEKILILQGLGYSAEVKDKKIIFKVGYSHPVELEIPDDIIVEVKPEKGKSLIFVRGIDKEKVGFFAAQIKKLKPADRYHAKGFRYFDEVIKLKPVKKVVK